LKYPRVWINIQKQEDAIIKIQKCWRGHSTRNMIHLLRGDMKIHEYANTEDLFTLDDTHLLNKFEFHENGKCWWFDVRTIFEWSIKSMDPCNPYTKQPLTHEVRQRLKEIVALRRLLNMSIMHEGKATSVTERFVIICQILEENGIEVHPNRFLNLTSLQIAEFVQLFEFELKNTEYKRFHFVICQFMVNQFLIPIEVHPSLLSNCLLYILRSSKTPYQISFMIASVLHRM
jgi:hypothetical protein